MLFLRHTLNHAKRIIPCGRPLSTNTGPLVDLTVDDDGIAIVTLQRPPVNSLSLELLQAFNSTLDDVAKNKPKGMVLTSAMPTIFCAGLDLNELHKPDVKRIKEFWTAVENMWLKLFGSAYPTAAAINGHAPAAGCLMAMSCEYRVMASGKYRIGLNESAFGIVVVKMFQATLNHVLPTRQAEIALTTGKLFTTDEALQIGLIDETARDKTDAVEKCKKFIAKFENMPPLGRGTTKQIFRQDVINSIIKNREENSKMFLDLVLLPDSQKAVEQQLINLKKKDKS